MLPFEHDLAGKHQSRSDLALISARVDFSFCIAKKKTRQKDGTAMSSDLASRIISAWGEEGERYDYSPRLPAAKRNIARLPLMINKAAQIFQGGRPSDGNSGDSSL